MTTNKQYCMCDACKDGSLHWFNCAVHNMPAAPNGPCNCGKYKPSMNNDQSAKPTERELFEAWCPCSYQQKDDDGDYDDPDADHYFEIWKSVRAPLLARIAELEAPTNWSTSVIAAQSTDGGEK